MKSGQAGPVSAGGNNHFPSCLTFSIHIRSVILIANPNYLGQQAISDHIRDAMS